MNDARRIVLDTNVVMALWHFNDPALAQLRAHCVAQGTSLLTRADCVDELRRVLAYSQFGIEAERQQAIHADYAALASCLAEPDEAMLAQWASLPRCGDRDDQKFLELALQGEAGLLLTRDKLLLKLARKVPFRDCMRIITPERFEQELRAAAGV